MKTLNYTLLLVLLSVTAYAQPQLDYSNSGYINYETFTVHGSDIPNANATGVNSFWSFSNITSLGSGPISTLPPAATPKDSIPLANVAQDLGNGLYLYYKSDVSGIELRGSYDGNELVQYTDPEVIMVFPFGFGYSHSDNWSYFNSDSTITRAGTTTVLADGYGTIQLPSGTFTNVLRTKLTKVSSDFAGGIQVGTFYATTVSWNLPGVRYPLAAFNQTQIDSFPITTASQYLDPVASPSAVKNVQQLENFISYYPNPVQNIITIETKLSGDYSIKITDLNGKKLIERTIKNKEQIDLSHFANGNYLLHLKKGNQAIAGELISVQH